MGVPLGIVDGRTLGNLVSRDAHAVPAPAGLGGELGERAMEGESRFEADHNERMGRGCLSR